MNFALNDESDVSRVKRSYRANVIVRDKLFGYNRLNIVSVLL